MSNGLKEKLIVVGGGLSLAVLICGTGLLVKSFTAKGSQSAEAHGAADDKAHGKAAKENAHGKEEKSGHAKESSHGKKGDSHGKTEGKGHAASDDHGKKSGHGEQAGHSKEESHGSSKKGHASQGHEEPGEETAKKSHKKPSTEYLMWRTKGDSAMACGRFDDAARHYALAVKKAPAAKKPAIELRLGDATRQSPSLPQQIRNQKALEIYSRVVAEAPKSEAADHAQFHVSECLTAQTRWQEALEALNRYKKDFPMGAHRNDARFSRAEVLATLGNPKQAGTILEELLEEEHDPNRKSRAILLLARVKLQMVRNGNFARKHEPPEVRKDDIHSKKDPQEEKIVPAHSQHGHPTEDKASTAHTSKDAAQTRKEKPTEKPAPEGIPAAQWAAIKRCVEAKNFKEAQRLIKPWLENNKDQAQSALLWSRWAQLLRELAEKGALDTPLDGILITSRAE